MDKGNIFEHFFEHFTHAVAAARLLLQNAHPKGSLIEGLILYAAIIDAILRNLIALKTGKRDGNTITLDEHYFLHDPDQWFSERKIYKKALDLNILTKPQFDELNELYDFRNRIIHRFILSQVVYSDLTDKLDKYEIIYQRVFAQLEEIEKPEDLSETRRESILEKIHKKIVR